MIRNLKNSVDEREAQEYKPICSVARVVGLLAMLSLTVATGCGILDTHVNRLLVLRPLIDDAERTAFLAGVFAYVGDPYDFRFGFADASRQVCTEVIYRALNGKSQIDFNLTQRAGHPTLSSDDIVLYHFATPGHFEVVAFAEEDPDHQDHRARIWTRAAAEQRLRKRIIPDVN